MQDVLIIGGSGGIGSALATAYRQRGAKVVTRSRRDDGLDLTQPETIATSLEGLGTFDRIIVATGALEIDGAAPEKTIRTIDAQAFQSQFAVNAIGPALLLSEAHRLLPKDRASVFAVLSARVGSIGDNRIGGWISYRSAKAALNQIVKTASIELARSHKQASILALHPGTVETEFTRKYLGRHPSVPPETAAENLLRVIEGVSPGQTGLFLDWAGTEVPW